MTEENINYIIDASFILGFLLPDEQQELTTEYFRKYKDSHVIFHSSPLLPFEVVNSIKSAAVSKRIDKVLAINLIDKFIAFKIPLFDVSLQDVFSTALSKNLSVYEASYIFLAKQYNMPFLTLDARLQKLSAA